MPILDFFKNGQALAKGWRSLAKGVSCVGLGWFHSSVWLNLILKSGWALPVVFQTQYSATRPMPSKPVGPCRIPITMPRDSSYRKVRTRVRSAHFFFLSNVLHFLWRTAFCRGLVSSDTLNLVSRFSSRHTFYPTDTLSLVSRFPLWPLPKSCIYVSRSNLLKHAADYVTSMSPVPSL